MMNGLRTYDIKKHHEEVHSIHKRESETDRKRERERLFLIPIK